MSFSLIEIKDYSEIAKNFATLFGVIGAGVYFLYKAVSGNEAVNLSLSVSTLRTRSPKPKCDYLSVTVKISKEDIARVDIHAAQARITCFTTKEVKIVDFAGVNRLNVIKSDKNHSLDWCNNHDSFISLPPREKTELSCVTEIDHDEAYTIEVVILGYRPRSVYDGQWRASHVSLPNVKELINSESKSE